MSLSNNKNYHVVLEFFMGQCYALAKELVEKGKTFFNESKARGVMVARHDLTALLNDRSKTALRYTMQRGLEKLGNLEVLDLLNEYNPQTEVVILLCICDKDTVLLSRAEKLNQHSCLLVEPNEHMTTSEIDQLPIEQCSCCGREDIALLLCARCRATKYCSKVCQVKEWPIHKLACNVWKK
jgi:hypothetical protein